MRALVWLMIFGLVGCAALRDDLRRAEQAFNDARYEDVEVWLTALESELPDMDRPSRARFYYLRGATAYRLEHRADARHYLALCREEAGEQGVGLKPEWQRSLAQMLMDAGAAQKTAGAEAPPSKAAARPPP